MKELLSMPLTLLTLTVGVYLGAQYFYRKVRFPLLHPLLVSIVVIIGYLILTGTSYERYTQSTEVIDMMLDLSIVALGYLLYEQASTIRGNAVVIMVSVGVGALVGILSVIFIARWMHVDQTIIASLQPKSTTTAIALALSGNSGGIPAITSEVVILVGIFGSLIGPWLLRILRVTDPASQGLALGAASHAMGTARAIEMGTVQGAAGGLAIGLMGLLTAVLIPVIERIL